MTWAPNGRSSVAKLAVVKRLAKDAGAHGDTAEEMVADLVRSLAAACEQIAETKALLRDRGFAPNGKRLADAVDEGLRITRRQDP